MSLPRDFFRWEESCGIRFPKLTPQPNVGFAINTRGDMGRLVSENAQISVTEDDSKTDQ
jgi:hypothetical protein